MRELGSLRCVARLIDGDLNDRPVCELAATLRGASEFVLLDCDSADIYRWLNRSSHSAMLGSRRMNMRAMKSLLALTLLCPCAGCLFTHASERVIRADEQLYEVSFESPLAEETFQACVAHPNADGDGQSGSFVGIPFLLAWARSERLSKNAVHNDQIILCDTNGDGMITNLEALRYRDRYFPNLDPAETIVQNDDDADSGLMSASFAVDTSDETEKK